ncbi:pancreatic triacylglycerol lipase-like [Aricia agestis]|uniref:pancreatic triacylglycerol lipase-like n=1 Tax=Aricia agestis TaxID=91739 RepID=UPI001C2079D2|nr:pancreatic triacylglycerol lipase-like [Aricia agestis]
MFLTKCLLVLCAAIAAHGFTLGPADVLFHLYTRTNPTLSQPLLPSIASIIQSSFSLNRKTVVLIHSYAEDVSGNFNAFVVPAHLEAEDINLLAVDWSAGCPMYTIGLGNTPQLGQVIADFMNILIDSFGYDVNLIRIVGVGLGGHAAGIAARKINGVVPHIIAIDPSLPGWTYHPDILDKDDAGVVEVLHATAGVYGYDFPLGDLDFYPNGGTQQAGCGTDTSCSHIYSYAFYAESITSALNDGNKFVGTACESYEEAVQQQCSGERDVAFGGTEVKQGVSGIYTFNTNMIPPFAQG